MKLEEKKKKKKRNNDLCELCFQSSEILCSSEQEAKNICASVKSKQSNETLTSALQGITSSYHNNNGLLPNAIITCLHFAIFTWQHFGDASQRFLPPLKFP